MLSVPQIPRTDEEMKAKEISLRALRILDVKMTISKLYSPSREEVSVRDWTL